MEWMRAVERVRDARQSGVLVTLATVRGHAPRQAGAKMVVAAGETYAFPEGMDAEDLRRITH